MEDFDRRNAMTIAMQPICKKSWVCGRVAYRRGRFRHTALYDVKAEVGGCAQPHMRQVGWLAA